MTKFQSQEMYVHTHTRMAHRGAKSTHPYTTQSGKEHTLTRTPLRVAKSTHSPVRHTEGQRAHTRTPLRVAKSTYSPVRHTEWQRACTHPYATQSGKEQYKVLRMVKRCDNGTVIEPLQLTVSQFFRGIDSHSDIQSSQYFNIH